MQAGQLHSKVWLDMLKQVAERQAEKEEAVAQLASIQNYRQWLEGGPASGLQHRVWPVELVQACRVGRQVRRHDLVLTLTSRA